MPRSSEDKPHKDIHYAHMGPWPVYVGFTVSSKAWKAEMRRLGVPHVPMQARGRAAMTAHSFTSKNGELTCIITGPPFNSSGGTREQYAAIIAHEATHVLQAMCDELNSGNTFGNEADAYLVQYITQFCLEIAWNSGKVRRTEP